MSYPGLTDTKFGRYQVAEPLHPETFTVYRGEALHTVDHEPPIPVLDQEDLLAQNIHTSTLISGARDVDALGSCTGNAGTASLAERYGKAVIPLSPFAGQALDEVFAIELYHNTTDQTGNPAQEWPPVDCGSSGYDICTELQRQKLITSHKTAWRIHGLALLLQSGSVIMGSPWFNSWMSPDASGFVDGDGSVGVLDAAIASGIAGGHETCITAIELLTINDLGLIDPDKTTVRVRNSWSSTWGDHGSYRLHLSTLQMLTGHVDYKQFVL